MIPITLCQIILVKDIKWQLPDLDTSEIGYTFAREAYRKAGREDCGCNGWRQINHFSKSGLQLAILVCSSRRPRRLIKCVISL